MILLNDSRLKWGGRAAAGGEGVFNAVQDVELKDFLKIVNRPVKDGQAESRQILIFVEIGFKRGQQFLGETRG